MSCLAYPIIETEIETQQCKTTVDIEYKLFTHVYFIYI